MLDLNAVRIFTQVVDAGSLSGAARQTGQPKSTISRKLSALEEQLGIRLLQRSTRALVLTEQGRSFYLRCQNIVREAEEAEQEVQASLAEPRGVLRVSAPVEEGNNLLGSVVADYLQKYPAVEIQLTLSNDIVDMNSGQFDLAIRAGILTDSSLIAVKLMDEIMHAFASPDYLARQGMPDSLDALTDHTTLLYGAHTRQASHHLVCGNRSANLTLDGRIAVNSLEMLRQLALAGTGIAFIPRHCCQADIDSGRLMPVLPQWHFPDSGIYAVYPHRKLLSPRVRTFIDHLKEHFTHLNG